MRRFEFSEGSANKFWQVAIADSELHIAWGKIGTAGQSQTKSFATGAAAQAELDKLVLEKTKKGYVEVAAGDAAPAEVKAAAKAAATATEPAVSTNSAARKKADSVPAADSVAVPAAAVATDSVAAPAAAVVTDSAPPPSASAGAAPVIEERVLPTERLRGYEPLKLLSVAECLAGLKEYYNKPEWRGSTDTPLGYLRGGLKQPPSVYRDFAERILLNYAVGKAPEKLDRDGEAALLQSAPPELVVPYLIARGGFGFLIEAMVHAAQMYYVRGGGVGGSYGYFEAAPVKIGNGVPLQTLVGVVNRLLPAMSEQSLAEARAVAAKFRREPLPIRLALAGALGNQEWLAEDTTQLLALKKNEYHYSVPSLVMLYLRDPALVTRLAARHPSDVHPEDLIHDLGLAAAPAVISAFAANPNNAYLTELVGRIETLAVAKALVEGLATKHSAAPVKEYYERRPDLGILAMAPVVARGDQIAPYVKPVLDAIVRAHPELPAKLAAHLDAKSRALFSGRPGGPAAHVPEASAAEVPKILSAPLPAPKRASAGTPLEVELSTFPKVLLHDKSRALPESAVAVLLTILQRSTLTAPHPALAEVKAACDAASLSAFAWALFEFWLASGGNSKENWAFTAVGLLGDDEAARRLTPLIRAWPGESQHGRAGVGLDILAGIGTDLALMHLHGVAEKVKYKALQEKAKVKIDAIAAARGLTAEELADRLVPDLGLDEDGSLTLDFGGRSFRVGFDEALAPVVRDPSGKTLSDLPKPNKSDDAAQATAASERWKTLKKDARAVASNQLIRLELAMCAQRRWQRADFDAFILRHPLLSHLARRLLWGVFDGAKLQQTFRVAEDGTLADADDLAVTLGADAVVGLVHRLDMPEALLGKWGGVFADYKILQPFDQLGRQVFFPTAAEKKARVLARFGKAAVKTGKVLGLETLGWRKGEPQDAGWVYDMQKRLPGGVVASFGLGGGLCMGMYEMNPPTQEIEGLHLESGGKKEVTFGDLAPVIFSELVREFAALHE